MSRTEALIAAQKCIDETVTVLDTFVASRKLTVLERTKLIELRSRLQAMSHDLPRMAKTESKFKPVLDLIGQIISRLF